MTINKVSIIYSKQFDITIIKYNNKKYNLNKNYHFYSFLNLIKKDKELRYYIKSYLRFNKNKKLEKIIELI